MTLVLSKFLYKQGMVLASKRKLPHSLVTDNFLVILSIVKPGVSKVVTWNTIEITFLRTDGKIITIEHIPDTLEKIIKDNWDIYDP
jgi:hypothetical protein